MRMLSHEEARAFYDWLGTRQDSQRLYEDPALADLLAHADFGEARSLFEFGCGTGRLAERLLSDWLPSDCRYQAVVSARGWSNWRRCAWPLGENARMWCRHAVR